MTTIVIISNGVFLRFPLSPKATANTSITINSLALFYHEIGDFSNRAYTKESGTEIGNSLEFDFVVPPPHS